MGAIYFNISLEVEVLTSEPNYISFQTTLRLLCNINNNTKNKKKIQRKKVEKYT